MAPFHSCNIFLPKRPNHCTLYFYRQNCLYACKAMLKSMQCATSELCRVTLKRHRAHSTRMHLLWSFTKKQKRTDNKTYWLKKKNTSVSTCISCNNFDEQKETENGRDTVHFVKTCTNSDESYYKTIAMPTLKIQQNFTQCQLQCQEAPSLCRQLKCSTEVAKTSANVPTQQYTNTTLAVTS